MKILVRKIEITRAEGPTGSLERATVRTFEDADQKLLEASLTAPETGGYDKTDFAITFDDGNTYQGTYDLKHFRVDYPNLRKHVVGHLEMIAGYTVPSWMSSSQYDNFMQNNEDQGIAAQCRDFLDDYDVKGEQGEGGMRR